ncbi:hypothetical protein R1flu_000522 [Riccia fluitans]|uniref:Uncharacterized protein n=1 Tax=Riccia fluitans TaxID=41844 RepID=A0ABD1Y3M6_9MARC
MTSGWWVDVVLDRVRPRQTSEWLDARGDLSDSVLQGGDFGIFPYWSLEPDLDAVPAVVILERVAGDRGNSEGGRIQRLWLRAAVRSSESVEGHGADGRGAAQSKAVQTAFGPIQSKGRLSTLHDECLAVGWQINSGHPEPHSVRFHLDGSCTFTRATLEPPCA